MKGTVKAVAHALITESTDVSGATTITYGELKYHKTKLSGTRQVSLDPKSSSNEVWADGVVAFAFRLIRVTRELSPHLTCVMILRKTGTEMSSKRKTAHWSK